MAVSFDDGIAAIDRHANAGGYCLALFLKRLGIEVPETEYAGTVVYVSRGGEYLGCIVIEDVVKENAAEAVAAGRVDLSALCRAKPEESLQALLTLKGVGVKVAACVQLFGLHQLDAFPIDVWIRRVLEAEYPGGYPQARYSPYNGVYQQYMFAYYRGKSF